jgi:hypothetical protein
LPDRLEPELLDNLMPELLHGLSFEITDFSAVLANDIDVRRSIRVIARDTVTEA